MLSFVVVMQSFIMNSHEAFIHIHHDCFAGTGAIVRLPQCQWSKPDGYGKNSQCITTTKHSKAKTVCIFLGIYCMYKFYRASDNAVRGIRTLLCRYFHHIASNAWYLDTCVFYNVWHTSQNMSVVNFDLLFTCLFVVKRNAYALHMNFT